MVIIPRAWGKKSSGSSPSSNADGDVGAFETRTSRGKKEEERSTESQKEYRNRLALGWGGFTESKENGARGEKGEVYPV